MDIVFILLKFAGALAVFLYAMKLMSESLQKIAGSKMRSILANITNNPVRGILTGTAVTVAIQSSSATTVMVVSFVNAGLLSLAGAVAVIMGANIGTTITAWIITLFGLDQGSGAFSLPMLLGTVSLLFLFSKKSKLKSIGEFVMGLALLLLGMDLLNGAMPNLEQYPAFLQLLGSWSSFGFGSILLFVAIGALLTCIVQASAAMMAITLVMCYKGWIGFDVAVALVMGQNIGTTITANLAAMVANTAGKRAARAHLLFNVVGVVLTLIVFRPVMDLITWCTIHSFGHNPYALVGAPDYSPQTIPLALSFFHTFFNVVNTLILAWFIPQIIAIVERLVPMRAEDGEDAFRLTYIAGAMMNTPELNIQSAQKEIEHFAQRVLRMYGFLPGLRTAKNEEEFDSILERIEKYESITDRMELEITQFLTRISEGDLSKEGSQRISAMLRIVDNLESIGDAIYQIALTRKNKRADAVHFTPDLNDNLQHITELVQDSLDVMLDNLSNDYNHVDLQRAAEAERAVNLYRDELRSAHLDALRHGVYGYAIGAAYSGLYALYEKLADYVINVSEAVAGRKVSE